MTAPQQTQPTQPTQQTQPAQPTQPAQRHQEGATQARRGTVLLFGIGGRVLNPVMKRLAGRRYVRGFAVLRHRGRRSGRNYATPVVVRQTAEGFVVPLPFGERTDWWRNVRAAGECVIRWNGVEYHLVEPQMMDWAAARPAFHGFERAAVPLLGIKAFVRFRRAPAVEGHAA